MKNLIQRLADFYKNKENRFLILYRLGMFIAILIPVVSVVNTHEMILSKEMGDFIPIILLAYGILHIFSLALFWFVNKIDSISAGSRIQTSGYLYTLISFVLLFTQLGNDFDFESILVPIGTALITSILGWFLGGEIYSNDKMEHLLRSEASSLIIEIQSFSSALKKAQNQYIEAMNNSNESMIEFHKSLKITNKNISELYAESEKATQVILKNLNGLNQGMLNVLEQTTNLTDKNKVLISSMEGLTTYLNQSRILLNELENIVDMFNKISDQ